LIAIFSHKDDRRKIGFVLSAKLCNSSNDARPL
jgi:hypothetical protein